MFKCVLVPYNNPKESKHIAELNAIPQVNEHILVKRNIGNAEYLIAMVTHLVGDFQEDYDVLLHVIFLGNV